VSRNYKIFDQTDLHYLTYATVGWLDALTRLAYKDIIVESLRHCQREKGLELFAWCIMSNHVHLIARAKEGYHTVSQFVMARSRHTAHRAKRIVSRAFTTSKSSPALGLS